jgi:hypothetical protein
MTYTSKKNCWLRKSTLNKFFVILFNLFFWVEASEAQTVIAFHLFWFHIIG